MNEDCTTLYLLRHGEAEGNVNRYFHGQYDSNLTENGEAQVRLAAIRLEKEPIDVIYASDLRRAYKTAQAVAERKGLPICVDPRLREIDGGDWENVRWTDLPHLFPESYPAWENAMHLLEIPNGESMVELQARIVSAVGAIADANRGKSVLIATHGTAIKAFLCHCYGYPLERIMEVDWHDNTAISKIEVDASHRYTIVYEGDSEHLGELSTVRKQKWWIKLQQAKQDKEGSGAN